MTASRVAHYTIDAQHSSVEFAVKHTGVSRVKGRFREFRGVLQIDEIAPTASKVDVIIYAASLDTNVPERDAHLRSADFLNVAVFPSIRYESTQVEQGEEDHWLIYGNLTVRGLTRPVVLDAEVAGRVIDVDGVEHIGLSAQGSVARRDFGINWNGWLGRYLVGEDIRITLEIEALKQRG